MPKKTVMLIAFYNTKALGVRYLEQSLVKSGFDVHVLFLKDFNSIKPKRITEEEINLAKKLIVSLDPGIIGLSVMSSLYLESVVAVNNSIKKSFNIPVVWGGVFASLFPQYSLKHADFVLRGECEEAIVDLADAVLNGKPYENIMNLAYKVNSGNAETDIKINELRPLVENLDIISFPRFRAGNKYFIENNALYYQDPLVGSDSYELSASRGCPFACSYCSSANLKRMYRGKGRFVRLRSVASVIGELNEAVSVMKNLKTIHFWDEIFPDDKDWINEFAYLYKRNIRLPFEIWGHPSKTDDYTMAKLVDAGLYQVVMGIQSGSERIRKIFRRSESQEEILRAAEVMKKQKVPKVIYDFMLRHSFEKEEDIQKTFELCLKLPRPFELQLHGLYFLPGTDIIKTAEDFGIIGKHDLESNLARPLQEQFNEYWGKSGTNMYMDFWYSLIFTSQFITGATLAKRLSRARKTHFTIKAAAFLAKLYRPAAVFRQIRKKGAILIRAYLAKASIAKPAKRVVQYNERS